MTTQKHSDAFISEMKTKLEEEKIQLNKELDSISVTRNGDRQVDPPEYGEHEDENASETTDTVVLNSVTETIEARLKNIIRALQAIEKGTYGLTDDGELIPEDRLRSNPAATTLVE